MPIRVRDLQGFQQTLEARFEDITERGKIRGLQAMGKKAIELIRSRTNRGIGRDGKRLPNLTVDYRYAKRQMIRGRWKFPKGSPRSSQFRAKRIPNHGRLSGGFFGSMSWVLSQGKLILTLKGNRARKIFEGLESSTGRKRGGGSYSKKPRKIWGLADRNTNQGKKEREELNKAFFEALR